MYTAHSLIYMYGNYMNVHVDIWSKCCGVNKLYVNINCVTWLSQTLNE